MVRIGRVLVLTVGFGVSSLGVFGGTVRAERLSSESGASVYAPASPGAVAATTQPDQPTDQAAPNSESDPPEATLNPGLDMTVKAGRRLTFDGTASSDPIGDGLRYEWRSTGRRGVASTKPEYSRKFPKPGRYFVKLTVIDAKGRQSSQQIWVTASENEPPEAIFTPGEDLTVNAGERLTFDGSSSTDPDGDGLWFEWRSTGRRGVASTKPEYSRKFPKPGRYFVEMTVIDAEKQRSSKRIWVTVADNQRPVASFTPGEDVTIETGQALTFDGSVSSDPDGDVLQYQWRSTGVRGVASRESSYSRTFDKAGRYLVKLMVVDPGLQRSAKSIWVTVTEEGPPVVEVKTSKYVFFYEDEINLTIELPFVLDASKSFDPDGGPLRYEWKFVETESGKSQVMSGQAKYADMFDFFTFDDWERDPNRLVLTVTDDEGDQTTYERPLAIGHFD